jgi:hypothetical protein
MLNNNPDNTHETDRIDLDYAADEYAIKFTNKDTVISCLNELKELYIKMSMRPTEDKGHLEIRQMLMGNIDKRISHITNNNCI